MNSQALRLARCLLEQKFSYSTTQINLPSPLDDFVVKWGRMHVQDQDLYYFDDGGGGRETEPHITVLYGLLEPEPSDALRQIVRRTSPFWIRLGPTSLFENEDFDVLKFSVVSPDLEALSGAIRQACPNENKYPKYIPHATIAYVKKGRAKHLNGLYPFEGYPPVPSEFEANTLIFSAAGDDDDPKRRTVRLPFNRTRNESLNQDSPFQGLWFPADASELASKILGLKKQDPKQVV